MKTFRRSFFDTTAKQQKKKRRTKQKLNVLLPSLCTAKLLYTQRDLHLQMSWYIRFIEALLTQLPIGHVYSSHHYYSSK